MGIELRVAVYGRPAVDSLAELLASLRGGDPLAPATVLVPTNLVGVATRRALARMSDRGIAGVQFSTIYRLAEVLGAPRLAAAGRRPVSTPILAAAVRTVLEREPGVFAATREHPATEKALLEVHRELSDLAADQLEALAAQGRRSADVVRIHRAVRSKLGSRWYDEQDLLLAATEALGDGGPLVATVGPVIAHLPGRLTAGQRGFLEALGAARPLVLLVGITGDPEVDADMVSEVEPMFPDGESVELPESNQGPPFGSTVISVSDADDEVRGVVRAIVEASRRGVSFDRLAVLYGSDQPYARLLHEQLRAAHVPFNGASLGTLAESIVGRTALALLALPERDFHRADLMALLNSAPIRSAGRLAPVAAWERASRAAGVVRGAEQWEQRLQVLAEDLKAELEAVEADEEVSWRAPMVQRELTGAEDLRAFVKGLVGDLTRSSARSTWRGRCSWLRGMLRRYLGSESVRESWPDEERSSAEGIESILERLAGLDAVEPDPSLAVFRRTLELEFEGGLGRQGHFGEGVIVGGLHLGVGLELEEVWVLGMAEGLLPTRPRDNSLLPDRERQVTRGALRTRDRRLLEQRRHYLAALAASGSGRTLTFPRGDLRRSNERMPSRWLLETAARHEGRQVFTPDLPALVDRPWFTEVPSHVAGLVTNPRPPTRHEYDVVSTLVARRSGEALASSGLATRDPRFARGLELIRARASSSFTRFDGNLGTLEVSDPTRADQVVSPTRLEAWSACPHAYLMRYLLGVQPIETPETVYSLGPLERGTLVHRALDAWLGEILERPDPGLPWSEEQKQRLLALARQEFRRLQDRGLVGGAVRWRFDQRQILADLAELVDRDNERRSGHGLRAVASEMAFGMAHSASAPLVVVLDDGRSLRFRGSADRVEVDPEGGIVVVDYKTGSDYSYKRLSEEDPDRGGTRLQLPIYAGAARREFGDATTPVRAAYWFVTSKRGFNMVELPLTESVRSRIDTVFTTIVDGMSAGIFPQHPDPEKFSIYTACPYCDPDDLGTRERRRAWERKAHAPELAAYVSLVEPDLIPAVGTTP